MLEEFMATNQIILANTGNQPTFIRGKQESHLDITMYSETLTGKVVNWKILEEETVSDHRYITFEIINKRIRDKIPKHSKNKWKFDINKSKHLRSEIQQKRSECLAMQRKITRQNRKYYKQHNVICKESIVEYKKKYLTLKKELGKLIMTSKKKAWKELINELENDI